jgi:hypothetical protein
MPDISMCSGEQDTYSCPRKDTCHRYTAKPNPYQQSYFMALPFDRENNICDHYWSNENIKPSVSEDFTYKRYKK